MSIRTAYLPSEWWEDGVITVISDLHLSAPGDPDVDARIAGLLEAVTARKNERLILLGDVYELWSTCADGLCSAQHIRMTCGAADGSEARGGSSAVPPQAMKMQIIEYDGNAFSGHIPSTNTLLADGMCTTTYLCGGDPPGVGHCDIDETIELVESAWPMTCRGVRAATAAKRAIYVSGNHDCGIKDSYPGMVYDRVVIHTGALSGGPTGGGGIGASDSASTAQICEFLGHEIVLEHGHRYDPVCSETSALSFFTSMWSYMCGSKGGSAVHNTIGTCRSCFRRAGAMLRMGTIEPADHPTTPGSFSEAVQHGLVRSGGVMYRDGRVQRVAVLGHTHHGALALLERATGDAIYVNSGTASRPVRKTWYMRHAQSRNEIPDPRSSYRTVDAVRLEFLGRSLVSVQTGFFDIFDDSFPPGSFSPLERFGLGGEPSAAARTVPESQMRRNGAPPRK